MHANSSSSSSFSFSRVETPVVLKNGEPYIIRYLWRTVLLLVVAFRRA